MKELLEKLAKGEIEVDEVLKAIDEADKEKVPRSRLNDKIDEIKELNAQLEDRDKQLKDLGKKAEGNEELQQTIKDLQKENDDTKTEYETKLTQQQKESKLEIALKDAKARNPKAVKALLNSDAISLDGDNLIGLEEQLTALKESDGYLFGEEDKLKGRPPHNPTPNNNNNEKNPFAKDSFNLTEQGKLVRDEPEKAKQLISQAGGNPALYGL